MFPYAYEVPVSKQVRVIMNTDAKNEADDQFAIVHGLLTSKFSIEGLIGAHFGTQRTNNSMEESYQEILHILDIMGIAGRIPVFRGSPTAFPIPIRQCLPREQRPLLRRRIGRIPARFSRFF